MPIEKPGASTSYNLYDSIVSSLIFTKEVWSRLPVVHLPNVMLIERDSGKIKFSDGILPYDELPYLIGRTMTEEELELLKNLNKPNGIVGLTPEGLIPDNVIPERYKRTMKILENYQALVTATEDPEKGEAFKLHIILVIDATGDPSGRVKRGGAQYAWYDPDGAGDKPSGWQITSVIEEPMISLENYFKLKGTANNTIGEIADDIDITGMDPAKYRRYSYADANLLGTIERNADVTDTENVTAAGAIMRTHILVGKQISAARLEQLYT